MKNYLRKNPAIEQAAETSPEYREALSGFEALFNEASSGSDPDASVSVNMNLDGSLRNIEIIQQGENGNNQTISLGGNGDISVEDSNRTFNGKEIDGSEISITNISKSTINLEGQSSEDNYQSVESTKVLDSGHISKEILNRFDDGAISEINSIEIEVESASRGLITESITESLNISPTGEVSSSFLHEFGTPPKEAGLEGVKEVVVNAIQGESISADGPEPSDLISTRIMDRERQEAVQLEPLNNSATIQDKLASERTHSSEEGPKIIEVPTGTGYGPDSRGFQEELRSQDMRERSQEMRERAQESPSTFEERANSAPLEKGEKDIASSVASLTDFFKAQLEAERAEDLAAAQESAPKEPAQFSNLSAEDTNTLQSEVAEALDDFKELGERDSSQSMTIPDAIRNRELDARESDMEMEMDMGGE